MVTPENLVKLRRGDAPVVMRGPYSGQIAEVDHIVSIAEASEISNELANLELLTAALNHAKSDKVGERQLAMAKKFRDAGLLSAAEFADVQARVQTGGHGAVSVAGPVITLANRCRVRATHARNCEVKDWPS